MTIILSTQADVQSEGGLNILGAFGDALGIPGLPTPNIPVSSAATNLENFANDINNGLNALMGKANTEKFDANFVGSGKEVMIGGNIEGGKVAPLEEASIRQIYGQTPQASVIIKKRVFAALKHLYDPKYMDKGEQWLLRATKKLIANKCAQMALYERLSKIAKLIDNQASSSAILASLITTMLEEESTANASNKEGGASAFTSANNLQTSLDARQPVSITTYFIDHRLPTSEDFGIGNGVFELTAIADVNTNLNVEGEGSCTFNVEDPYKILFVTEEDIERAINETSLSGFVRAISMIAASSLDNAQTKDELLNTRRRERGKSEISFTIGVGGNAGVRAVLDAIGFQITKDNLADVPENQALNADEQSLFKSAIGSLETYEQSMRKSLLDGLNGTNAKDIAKDIEYARKKMRLFYLGKSIIQPMDTVHIYMDGGTRKLGEGESIEPINKDMSTLSGALGVTGSIFGLQDEAQLDESVLALEWKKDGQHMRFEDYRKLRMSQSSGEGGIQVFEGLVKSVLDKYDASSGKYSLSVSAGSVLEWLQISRYNTEPSLDQSPGFIYDPLTPFEFQTNPANGLPTGVPQLSASNKEFIKTHGLICNSGPLIGKRVYNETDMQFDTRKVGASLIPIYQHVPGLMYKWKEGIMTMTYNHSTINPLDGSRVNLEQLRRDVGQFGSNTAFDNMDSANILSVLITGFPYNLTGFLQSTRQTRAFNLDTSMGGKDFFHSFLEIQRSMNSVQGNFIPFKPITDNKDMVQSLVLQEHLTNKSGKLSQLMRQQAQDQDQLKNIGSAESDMELRLGLAGKIKNREKEIVNIQNEVLGLTAEGRILEGSVLEVVGNDIFFTQDVSNTEEELKMFGDKLTHATLKRREEVVYNKSRNYFIVSDEYDKDYDIQAFVLKLKASSPDMFKFTLQSVFALCQSVAKTIDFEFFADSQGHIIFRPPQYNKVPASVLNKILALNKNSGIKLYPDFLTSLFQSREESLTNDVVALEWEIRMRAALLGKTTISEVEQMIYKASGGFFITEQLDKIKGAAKKDSAQLEQEKIVLQYQVNMATAAAQLSNQSEGAFSVIAQRNLQNEVSKNAASKSNTNTFGEFFPGEANENAYEEAQKALFRLRGQKPTGGDTYAKAKVGALRNGVSTPETDISRVVSDIASLVSTRSKLMKMLGKVLEQNIEIGAVSKDGKMQIKSASLTSTADMNSSLYQKLIEEDTKNVLGHLSGSRFIIKDEDIISFEFTEKPPDHTVISVAGTEPLVGGEKGMLGSYPQYLAYGADFDLWRQYGFRQDKMEDRPFLWSAEQQCAPYAVMLLSRQRKNIMTGSITVRGNEFYQLGDVVFIQERQLLYYVNGVSHKFGYGSNFTTTLTLTYGHAPGEYIPTPLDVIGKNLITSGASQNAFRVRREIPRAESILGTIRFMPNSIDLLGGAHGQKNFNELKNASIGARTDIKLQEPKTSSKLFILAFGGDKTSQLNRAAAIRNWFSSPATPSQAQNGISSGGLGFASDGTSTIQQADSLGQFMIPDDLIEIQYINQFGIEGDLSETEKTFLFEGVVASEKTIAIDRTLATVIELRLRQAPPEGWS